LPPPLLAALAIQAKMAARIAASLVQMPALARRNFSG